MIGDIRTVISAQAATSRRTAAGTGGPSVPVDPQRLHSATSWPRRHSWIPGRRAAGAASKQATTACSGRVARRRTSRPRPIRTRRAVRLRRHPSVQDQTGVRGFAGDASGVICWTPDAPTLGRARLAAEPLLADLTSALLARPNGGTRVPPFFFALGILTTVNDAALEIQGLAKSFRVGFLGRKTRPSCAARPVGPASESSGTRPQRLGEDDHPEDPDGLLRPDRGRSGAREPREPAWRHRIGSCRSTRISTTT